MQRSIQIPKEFSIKYCKVGNKQFFFLSEKDFFLIPNDYTFSFKNKLLTFECSNVNNNVKRDFNKFISRLFRFIKKKGNPFLKKLIFKGLGLKASLISQDKILELKLGFSHLIRLPIPEKKIRIKVIKNGLLIFGNNLVTVCNFMYKIKSLKLPNIYKGKGIWYKNEVIHLKEIKKS